MLRPTTKNDLMAAAKQNYEKLNLIISKMTEEELSTPFDFSKDEKKKETHWRRDKNLKDVLIHLYEWHRLVLNWVNSNQNGEEKPFLPKPYNWKTYGDMNVEFWKKYQKTSLEEATKMLHKLHKDILKLAKKITNEELFSKNVYSWVGGSVLGSYFASATSSHYEWAMKKSLRLIRKIASQNSRNRMAHFTKVKENGICILGKSLQQKQKMHN